MLYQPGVDSGPARSTPEAGRRPYRVWHAEFEHGSRTVIAHHGRDPRAAPLVAAERASQRHPPPGLQFADRLGQPLQPGSPLRHSVAGGRKSFRDGEHRVWQVDLSTDRFEGAGERPGLLRGFWAIRIGVRKREQSHRSRMLLRQRAPPGPDRAPVPASERAPRPRQCRNGILSAGSAGSSPRHS